MAEETGTTYPLGVAPLALIVTSALCFGFGGYLAWGSQTGPAQAVFVRGHLIAGPDAVAWATLGMGVLFLLAGGYLVLRTLRNLRTPGFVRLTANAVIHSGFNLSGGEQRLGYAEIVRVSDMVLRGMPVTEIEGRDGSRIVLGQINFRDQADYDRFRTQLRTKVPQLGWAGG